MQFKFDEDQDLVFTLMQICLPKMIWIQIWICKIFLLFIILATFEYFFTFFQPGFCTVYKISVFKYIILVLQFIMFMFVPRAR